MQIWFFSFIYFIIGLEFRVIEVSILHTVRHTTFRRTSSQRPLPEIVQHAQDRHVVGGIRTCNPSKRTGAVLASVVIDSGTPGIG